MKRAERIIQEVESRTNQGAGIENFRAYLRTIHNPQDAFFTIHIAGTNGKGSTLNYLRSIFQEAGYRVGTFSSPYLEVHYDRIRINDEFIDESDFLMYYDRFHNDWETCHLSAFEIDTVIAFLYFKDQKVDIAIIETGIGGRYDCTNVIVPLVSVITNIGMDHMDRLGSSKAEIAWQKGGIIKEHVPLVCAESDPHCLQVLQTICDEMHTHMVSLKEITDVQSINDTLSYTYDTLRITLANTALYQLQNSACALESIRICKDRYHMNISDAQIQSGLAKAVWKGRFEKVWEQPVIILDGAHNEDGVRALCKTLQGKGKIRILFSALKDKDTHPMLELLCESFDDICVCDFAYPRAKPAEELAETFPVCIDHDYKHAITKAMQDPTTPLVITGSLYFISQVRAFLMEMRTHTQKKR